MKVNGWAYFTQSLPTKLYLPSLGSHSIKLRGLKNENLGTSSFVLICWLPERIRSVFSHIVRKDTSNLLEPSPASRWYDYTYYFFSLSIIFIYLEYSLACCTLPTLRYLPYHVPPRRQQQPWQWRSPPLVRNHAKTWWGLRRHRQKIYRRIARVSARWFDATAEKKAQVFNKKTYLLSQCTLVSGL